MYYTGVGSRETPNDVLTLMTSIAKYIRISRGYTLRTGDAKGADSAFAAGAAPIVKMYTAKDASPRGMEIAAHFHPAWNRCSDFAKKLHGRNANQVLGDLFTAPSRLLICWTPDGCLNHQQRSIKTGGTGTAISIADHYDIPIWNLQIEAHRSAWQDFVNRCHKFYG